MGKAICYIFIGLLLAGFFKFLRMETRTATRGTAYHYPDGRPSILKTVQ